MTHLISAIFIFAVFFVASLLVDKGLKSISYRFEDMTGQVFRIVSNSQKVVLITIGTIMALSELGFNVSALVAGLGLTGFAVGLALKDAISNLVAGIMIIIYKPIVLGDTVELAGSKGKVVDVNLRYITLQAEGVTHLLPNSLILNNKVSVIEDLKEENK